jgi:hypothetical protein
MRTTSALKNQTFNTWQHMETGVRALACSCHPAVSAQHNLQRCNKQHKQRQQQQQLSCTAEERRRAPPKKTTSVRQQADIYRSGLEQPLWAGQINSKQQ